MQSVGSVVTGTQDFLNQLSMIGIGKVFRWCGLRYHGQVQRMDLHLSDVIRTKEYKQDFNEPLAMASGDTQTQRQRGNTFKMNRKIHFTH